MRRDDLEDLDELKRQTSTDLRAARERREERQAREHRDGPILAAYERLAAGEEVPYTPGPRHAPRLTVVDEPAIVTAPGQAPEAKWAEREARDRGLDFITGKDGSVVGHGTIKLGQIVHVRGFAKGEHRAHVVLDPGSVPGRIVVAYCATDRWQTPKTYAQEFIITELQDNAHVRRARRWLEREPYDADGWKRIGVGPLYNPVSYRVGHKDVP